MNRIEHDFFNRDTCTVAKELLGQKLVFHNKTGVITEKDRDKKRDLVLPCGIAYECIPGTKGLYEAEVGKSLFEHYGYYKIGHEDYNHSWVPYL